MIYDAIAANKPSTHRLEQTREFLAQGRSDVIRKNWRLGEQQPEQIARQQERHKDWSNLVIPSPTDLQHMVSLIPHSWAIQFTFKLATPYLSKGIEAFDLLDNPIIRDKVYEVPIVPASSWKGGLRAAALMCLFESIDAYAEAVKHAHKLQEDQQAKWDSRLRQLVRIFGVEKEIEHDYSAGRLHCFPTGFEATRCEVINPHDRARRVGTNPILLECVPAEEEGTFTVLYVPFGDVQQREAAEDLMLCAQAIASLLLEWGIGAKKSDGNGLAKDEITRLYVGPQKQMDAPEPQPPSLPDVCRRYEQDAERFSRSHAEWEQRPKQHTSVLATATLTNLADIIKTQATPDFMEENH
jgi:CRISPR/Cas system CSM-associated protein Csm3 (group 7 of RAMP superfamily)